MGWYLWPLVAILAVVGVGLALESRSPRWSRVVVSSVGVVIVIAAWPTSGWWLRAALVALTAVGIGAALRKT